VLPRRVGEADEQQRAAVVEVPLQPLENLLRGPHLLEAGGQVCPYLGDREGDGATGELLEDPAQLAPDRAVGQLVPGPAVLQLVHVVARAVAGSFLRAWVGGRRRGDRGQHRGRQSGHDSQSEEPAARRPVPGFRRHLGAP
jgi:hypothetical protein